jgi:RNA recognition motif-containing protein
MNIFVGNLAFDATQDDIKKLFEGFGNVTSAVIVMSREKKAPKSRGFGFVEMPDEEQALAAIAALNEKEFMGRILNISQARPKTEADRQSELKMKMQLRAKAKAELLLRKEQEQQKVLANPILNQHLALKDGRVRPSGQPGTYRGGRRTRSYIKQRSSDGIQEEIKPWRKGRDNPMRWRKRKNQSRPWKKTGGENRTWSKPGEESRPWKKSAGEAKPWSKSSERPQESRFNPSTSLGMVRGNGGRSRTKGRKKTRQF